MQDATAEHLLHQDLAPGERLIWEGRPLQGLRIRSSDYLTVPGALIIGCVSVYMFGSLLTHGAPLPVIVFAVPFTLVLLHFVIGHFFTDALIRAHIYYGLTARRAIILSGVFSRKIVSVPLQTVSEVAVRERRDGSGTVTLGGRSGTWGLYDDNWWESSSRQVPPTLNLIPDARDVYEMVLQARDAAR